jgi:HD-like signal output (HDOD) protein
MTTSGPRPALDPKKILAAAQLPALPQSAVRLLQLSQDPDLNLGDFSQTIEVDPGLTSQILRFVNSSYFGFVREISSVKQAITMVGMRTIKNFALWNAVFSLMPNPRCGPFDLKQLWQDSLRRALFARHVMLLLGNKEGEEAFAAALLQDMAVPLLAKESPTIYVKLLQTRGERNIRLSSLEDRVLRWNHATVGGMMARQWNLPEQFSDILESHITVEPWIAEPRKEPTKLAVSMSALLPPLADPIWFDCALLEEIYQKVLVPAGPSLVDLLGEIDQEFAQFAPLLRISTPAKSLVQSYQEVAVATA